MLFKRKQLVTHEDYADDLIAMYTAAVDVADSLLNLWQPEGGFERTAWREVFLFIFACTYNALGTTSMDTADAQAIGGLFWDSITYDMDAADKELYRKRTEFYRSTLHDNLLRGKTSMKEIRKTQVFWLIQTMLNDGEQPKPGDAVRAGGIRDQQFLENMGESVHKEVFEAIAEMPKQYKLR